MTDYLAELNVQEVAAWYNRLAASVSKEKINGQEPLSSLFLKTWLKNRSRKYTLMFRSPMYLKNSKYVKDTLADIRIQDARALDLMLPGGVTGKDVADYHDWEYLPGKLGLLRMDHALACMSQFMGIILMITALVWGR